jgi:glycosyltransferase involved in cell wall biosynthesis
MRIVHVFRAPVGGLFRHVMDLVKEQVALGHDVGVFCDAHFAGERNENLLEDLSEHLSLGLVRVPMHRNPNGSDLKALTGLRDFAQSTRADVLHGHGSKGGFYARLGAVMGARGPVRAYTPHGGSLNYKPGTPIHRLYMGIERVLERGTDLFLFESEYIAERYRSFVCEPSGLQRVVLNGLYPHEFERVHPAEGARDFLYIGEYRFAKGLDTLLDAMAKLAERPEGPPTLVMVGQGPEETALRSRVMELGLDEHVSFRKPMAARDAFRLARVMVVPSRFESMPYVVIEAAGACMPMISTNVGGIPEIFGEEVHRLLAPEDVGSLATAMASAQAASLADLAAPAERLQLHIRENFSVANMAVVGLEAYAEAAARRGGPGRIDKAAVHGKAG